MDTKNPKIEISKTEISKTEIPENIQTENIKTEKPNNNEKIIRLFITGLYDQKPW